MNSETDPVPQRDIETVRASGKLLFDLGMVVATPAAIEALRVANTFPAALLSYHAHGDWGQLDAHDGAMNNQAIIDGGRILSVYLADQVKLYVITEAVGDDGRRASTTILRADEY